MTHWEALLPTAQTWSKQASITKTQNKNLSFSIIIGTSKGKQFEMLAFIGRVAIKLAVNGGSLKWTFFSDAEQKCSLFRFFEKYYLQLLTSLKTELLNITITKKNISIRKKLSLSQHALNTYLVKRCVQFGRQLWLRRKERGKLALEKNQLRSSIKVWDNEGPSLDPTLLNVDKVKLLKQDTNRKQLTGALPLQGKWN